MSIFKFAYSSQMLEKVRL